MLWWTKKNIKLFIRKYKIPCWITDLPPWPWASNRFWTKTTKWFSHTLITPCDFFLSHHMKFMVKGKKIHPANTNKVKQNMLAKCFMQKNSTIIHNILKKTNSGYYFLLPHIIHSIISLFLTIENNFSTIKSI